MVRHTPAQAGLQDGNLGPHLPLGQLGECVGVVLAGDDRLQHETTGDAQHVRGHRCQLDIGILNTFWIRFDTVAFCAYQLGPLPRRFPQLTLRRRRNETAAQQAVLQQLRDPFAIFHVGLAAGTCLMCRALTNSIWKRVSKMFQMGFQ